ncbi:HpcH/HpaI aldolase/citrate lyase family protein [Croceicoccus marinus]|uniref:CoA ester lyase n=1 Tax=Croceicoccus marinus TaxID=450378 RepID=A0A1Z1FGM1_9SPHN|nr:CoA ester lyase [Croceicoccus marinus]ARU17885.1 CoA ester lyase [Croceicoccus marinus]QNE07393.1 CoA ester lyase [Croceicoccus marinus]
MTETIPMRSWLFAPGDSERKMLKCAESDADIALFDLEDAVTVDRKPDARSMVRDLLHSRDSGRERLWVRINPVDGPFAVDDLAAVMPGRPGGIMLPKSRGRRDVELLDHYLTALEAANGIAQGSTKVIALVTEAAEAMFTTGDYAGAPRLAAMTWGAEDLADALGASNNRDASGDYDFTYRLARSLCLIGAASAGVLPIETIHGDFRDIDGLRARADMVRAQGYRGMLAIHPAQVAVINEAFTPSEKEIAAAQEIVDLFAANPGVGAIGYKGGMLDRPYLARAETVLRLAGRS